jgi:hypothetical protein
VSYSAVPMINERDPMKGTARHTRGAVIGTSRVESQAAKICSMSRIGFTLVPLSDKKV